MPGESIRNRVGRWPGVTLWDDEPMKVDLVPENNKEKEEGTCQRWFHKICPCCYRLANNEPDDTGTEITVGLEDHSEKPPAETTETNGEVLNAVHYGRCSLDHLI